MFKSSIEFYDENPTNSSVHLIICVVEKLAGKDTIHLYPWISKSPSILEKNDLKVSHLIIRTLVNTSNGRHMTV